MELFPQRDRRDRNVLTVALVLSLLMHLIGAGAWVLFAPRVATVLAKLVPRPTPTPEFVATSDAITIEKRTVPRAMRRSPPQRPHAQPRPRRVAQQLTVPRAAVPAAALPTLPPPARGLPTTEPTAEPTFPPRHATIHHPRAGASAAPPRVVAQHLPAAVAAPQTARSSARTSTRSAFSPQQIAALDAQFSKTIAQAQRSLTDVPRQSRRPATTMKRYQLVMAGSRGDLTSAQGQCRATQTWYRGPTVWHYMDCDFVYTDGFSEHVLVPWPQQYPRNDDPEDHPYKMYLVEDPPPGWQLPHPFAFSRLVCIFYKSDCQALIERERANGDPNYAPP